MKDELLIRIRRTRLAATEFGWRAELDGTPYHGAGANVKAAIDDLYDALLLAAIDNMHDEEDAQPKP